MPGAASATAEHQGATPANRLAAKPGTQPEQAQAKADPHITGQRNRPQPDPAPAAEATVKAGEATVEAAEATGRAAEETGKAAEETGKAAEATGRAAEATVKAVEDDKAGKRKPEGSLSRLAAYKAEVAELLGGDSAARRRRKNTTASGLPAADPETQEPPIKLTRPPRKGGTRAKD